MSAFKNIATIFFLSVGAMIALVGCLVLQKGCSWTSKAVRVVEQQVDPTLLLKRYEWFKNVYAECDKKLADISVYQNRLSQLEQSYNGVSRKDWDRTDKEQFNLWSQEVAGTIASYNSLAAEYNAAMAKINYKFTNIGDLPSGATQVLPREVREYKTQ